MKDFGVEGPVFRLTEEKATFCGGCDFFDKTSQHCDEPSMNPIRRELFILRESCGYASIDRVFGTMSPEGFKPSPLFITG